MFVIVQFPFQSFLTGARSLDASVCELFLSRLDRSKWGAKNNHARIQLDGYLYAQTLLQLSWFERKHALHEACSITLFSIVRDIADGAPCHGVMEILRCALHISRLCS